MPVLVSAVRVSVRIPGLFPVRRVLLGLVRSSLAGLLVIAAGCGQDPGAPRRSAILITLDTTRPDALTLNGGPAGLTPNIDALAREGILFERAYTVAPLTLPAHASMLTGLWPPHHGIRENGIDTLSPEAHTLAEAARQEGYQTAAFVAALVLDGAYGLDQGFDVYQGPDRSAAGRDSHSGEDPADVVVDRALAWLAKRDRERPFFLWVHLFDPHAPYAPPARFQPKQKAGAQAGVDPRHLYMGEIAFTDSQVGRLLKALRAEGLLEESALALVADHGEAFGEHGEPTHSAYVWDTTLHVPMIFRTPAMVGAGSRSQALASVVDIYPTLGAAMGLQHQAPTDGRDLLAGPGPADRGVYFESYSGYLTYGWSHLAGWRDNAGKYIHSSKPQFFDTRADPREERDLLAGDGFVIDLAPYQRALGEVGSRPSLGSSATPVDQGLMEEIRGLGYGGLGSSGEALPAPLSHSDRVAPQDCLHIYTGGLRAQAAANREDYEEAIALMQPLLDEQPDNPFLLDRITTSMIRLRRHAEAVPYLERLLEVGPGWPGSVCNLGLAYYKTGRAEEALVMLERAVSMAPQDDFFWDALIGVLDDLGKSDESLRRRLERDELR